MGVTTKIIDRKLEMTTDASKVFAKAQNNLIKDLLVSEKSLQNEIAQILKRTAEIAVCTNRELSKMLQSNTLHKQPKLSRAELIEKIFDCEFGYLKDL